MLGSSDRCRCHCHSEIDFKIRHIMACCHVCPVCEGNITFMNYKAHVEGCTKNREEFLNKIKEDLDIK